jgi:hypothetical protein
MPRLDLVKPGLGLLEPHLAESHTTVIIPFDNHVFFVSLLDCANFSSRLSEVAQTLDSISGILKPSGPCRQRAHISILVSKQWGYANQRVRSDAKFCLHWKLLLHLLIDFLEKHLETTRSLKRRVRRNWHFLTVLSLDNSSMQPFGNGENLRDKEICLGGILQEREFFFVTAAVDITSSAQRIDHAQVVNHIPQIYYDFWVAHSIRQIFSSGHRQQRRV